MKKEIIQEYVIDNEQGLVWFMPVAGGIEKQGRAFPVGTKITMIAEIPEPKKERIVLPEGMQWDIADLLWTADGNLVASARSGTSWYRQPFVLAHFNVPSLESIEATKQIIEAALAEHGYFGVRKVVEND